MKKMLKGCTLILLVSIVVVPENTILAQTITTGNSGRGETEQYYVAVLPLESQGGLSAPEAQVLTARLRDELVQIKQFTVLDRGNMENILQEQNFQLSGCASNECAVEVGRLLGVNRMVAGSIGKIGQTYSISARLINVETGEITKTITDDYRGEIDGLLLRMKAIAQRLAGLEPTVTLTGTSNLQVSSNPSGGQIFIDGTRTENITPYTFHNLEAGKHEITVRKNGLIGETVLSLEQGDSREVSIELSQEMFTFQISSEPSGADVYLDDQSIGQTPVGYQVTDTTKQYIIRVEKEDYSTRTDTVKFKDSNILSLDYTLPGTNGMLVFPYASGMKITINGISLDEYNNRVIGSFADERYGQKFLYQRLSIRNLPLRDYQVRIEQEGYYPFIRRVDLTPDSPTAVITPDFEMFTADLIIHNGSTAITGKITRDNFIKEFQLKPAEEVHISVPMGIYQVHAESPGYYNFNSRVTASSTDSQFVNILMKRPNKTRAIMTSLIIPGGGQFYTNQGNKGTFFFMATLGSIGWSVKIYGDYMNELDLFHEYVEDYLNAKSRTSLEQSQEKLSVSSHNLRVQRRRFLIGLGVTAFTYLLNLNDIAAFFDESGNLENFNIDVSSYEEQNGFIFTLSYQF